MARILCVEDESEIREEIAEALLDCGHCVVQAENGVAALALLEQFRPDLVVTDSLMPVMTGPEFLMQLRGRGDGMGEVPVILVSACADRAHKERAQRCGATAYVTMPMDLEQLESLVRQVLGQESPGQRIQ